MEVAAWARRHGAQPLLARTSLVACSHSMRLEFQLAAEHWLTGTSGGMPERRLPTGLVACVRRTWSWGQWLLSIRWWWPADSAHFRTCWTRQHGVPLAQPDLHPGQHGRS